MSDSGVDGVLSDAAEERNTAGRSAEKSFHSHHLKGVPFMLAALRTALCFAFFGVVTSTVAGCATEAGEEEENGTTEQELGGHGGWGGGGHGGGPGGPGAHGEGHRHRRKKNGQAPQWHHGHGHGHEIVQVPADPVTGNAIVADVDAQGTGCPDGSWDASISEDGQTFTLRFNQYEASISANQDRDTKDCRVSVKLTSPQGLSYSVASFYYSGYVFLENDGMRASYSARYSFLEDPRTMRRADRDILTGPRDESFTFQSDPQPIWSPCGGSSTLNIDTRVTVINNRQRSGAAFMNNSAIDGTVGNDDGSLAMTWKLGWRRCR